MNWHKRALSVLFWLSLTKSSDPQILYQKIANGPDHRAILGFLRRTWRRVCRRFL